MISHNEESIHCLQILGLGQVTNLWINEQALLNSWISYIEAFLQVSSPSASRRLEKVLDCLISGIQDKLGVPQIALVQF